MTVDSQARAGDRKTGFGQDGAAPGVECVDGVWQLRSYAAVRGVLRDGESVRQGASTDNPLVTRVRPAVIFQDGEAHREQRAAIARFFAPKTVDRSYQVFIDELTARLLGRLRRDEGADISALSMELSVEVAARVVGLTDSRRRGMDRRIEALLAGGNVFADAGRGVRARVGRLLGAGRGLAHMADFLLTDVRPAVRRRRADPQPDVISHLVGKGYNQLDILVECLTYATAGMVTTREFISVATWHLLQDDALRRRYLDAEQAERRQVLHEILRLEPVASTLWRRAERELTIMDGDGDGDGEWRIPAGALMVLDLRRANADAQAVGAQPLSLRTGRPLAAGVRPEAMSFGDGAHRCPGAFLAIHESDLFLRQLLALPLRLVGEPRLEFNPMLASYEIRDLRVELAEPRHRKA